MTAASQLVTINMHRADNSDPISIVIDCAHVLGSGNEGTNYLGQAALGHAALAVKVCKGMKSQRSLFEQELAAHRALTRQMHPKERDGYLYEVPQANRAHIIPLLAYRAVLQPNVVSPELDLASPLAQRGVREAVPRLPTHTLRRACFHISATSSPEAHASAPHKSLILSAASARVRAEDPFALDLA